MNTINLSDIGGIPKLTKAELEKLHPKTVRFLVQTMFEHVENVIYANRPLSEGEPSDTVKVDIKSLKDGAPLIAYILDRLRSYNWAVQNIIGDFNNMSDVREERRPTLLGLLNAYEKTLPAWTPPLVRKTGSITHVNLRQTGQSQGIADIAFWSNLKLIMEWLQTTPDGQIRFTKIFSYMIGKEEEETHTCPLYHYQDGKKAWNRRILEGWEVATVPVQIGDGAENYQIGEYNSEHGTTTLYGHKTYNGVFGDVQLIEKDGVVSPRTLQEGDQIFMLGKREGNTTELVHPELRERYDDRSIPWRRIPLGTSVERKRLGSFQLNAEGEAVSIKKTPEGLWLWSESEDTTELYNPETKKNCYRQLDGLVIKTVTQEIPIGVGWKATVVYEMGGWVEWFTQVFPKGSEKCMRVCLEDKDGSLSIKSVEGRPWIYISEAGVDKKQGTYHLFSSNGEEYGWRQLNPDNTLAMSDGFEFGVFAEKTGLVEIYKPGNPQIFDHVQADKSPEGVLVIKKTSDGKYFLGKKDGECTELIRPDAKHFCQEYGNRILDDKNTIQTVVDNEGKIYEIGLQHRSSCYIYEPGSRELVTSTIHIIKKEDGSFDFRKAHNGAYYVRLSDWGEKVLLKSFGKNWEEDIYWIRMLNEDGIIRTVSDNEGKVYELVRVEEFMKPWHARYKKSAIVWHEDEYYKGDFNEDETMIQDLAETDAPRIDYEEDDIPF